MTDGGKAGSEEQGPLRWRDRTNCLFIQGGVKNRHRTTNLTDEDAGRGEETTVGVMGTTEERLQTIDVQMRGELEGRPAFE